MAVSRESGELWKGSRQLRLSLEVIRAMQMSHSGNVQLMIDGDYFNYSYPDSLLACLLAHLLTHADADVTATEQLNDEEGKHSFYLVGAVSFASPVSCSYSLPESGDERVCERN